MSSDVIVEAHVPCVFDDCDSSDGFTWYEDHGYCFVCNRRKNGGRDGETSESTPSRKKDDRPKDLLDKERVQALTARSILLDTCKKFDYFIAEDDKGKLVQVAPYRDQDGKVVAQKVRGKDKTFRTTGKFKDVQLYGQHLWKSKGGKRLVITEGEIDALSAYQMLGSWPVVSLPNGAQSAVKSIRTNLEFVESYEQVILCFDQDDPGQEAAQAVAELLSPGKAKIMVFPEKDASDMLTSNRVKEFVTSFWEARSFEPDGIVNGSDLWDLVSTEAETGQSLPWDGLSEMTYGQRGGELWTWTSGSGMGKSEVVSQLAHYNLTEHGEVIGYVALEESLRRTGQRLMAKELRTPIHLPGYEVSLEDRRKAFEETTGSGRVFLYDHWGSQESDKILSKIRFLIRGNGCQTIILDHLSIIVSGLEDDDERKTIDRLMTDLRSLVEETGVKMHLVSHLKRPPQGKGHEEGAQVSLAHLRGSHSIVQLSDFVIGLERNQQSSEDSDVTRVRVLKNRYAGTTGLACALKYDRETGMLDEVPLEEDSGGFSDHGSGYGTDDY